MAMPGICIDWPRCEPGQPAASGDLWAYTQDLRYTEIDSPLLARLLRTCLQAWHDDLRGTHTGYGGFVEHFYPVLADRHVFDTHLNPTQAAVAAEFMRRCDSGGDRRSARPRVCGHERASVPLDSCADHVTAFCAATSSSVDGLVVARHNRTPRLTCAIRLGPHVPERRKPCFRRLDSPTEVAVRAFSGTSKGTCTSTAGFNRTPIL